LEKIDKFEYKEIIEGLRKKIKYWEEEESKEIKNKFNN
jgi:hypothetical protein